MTAKMHHVGLRLSQGLTPNQVVALYASDGLRVSGFGSNGYQGPQTPPSPAKKLRG